jgi:hypothetical protein
VHSVRDRGVGGSNPLAPTNKNGRKLDEKALQPWRAFFICASTVGGSRVTQAQAGRVGCSVATSVATCSYKCLSSTVIKIDGCGEVGRCLTRVAREPNCRVRSSRTRWTALEEHLRHLGIIRRRSDLRGKQSQLVPFARLVDDLDRLRPSPLRRVIQLTEMTQRRLPRTIRRVGSFRPTTSTCAVYRLVAVMTA